MTPDDHNPPPDPHETVGRRATALQDVARRFRHRWISGIALGAIIVVVNTLIDFVKLRNARTEVGGFDGAVDALKRLEVNSAITGAMAMFVLVLLTFKFLRPLDKTLAAESEWLEAAERQQLDETARRTFDAEVHEALDFAADDIRLSLVTDHILKAVAPDNPSELLLADASDAHMTTWAANREQPVPGCDVPSPFECPAVKRSRPYTALSSEAINACPHLRNRASGSCAAHCVPVAFMGKALGVLHLTAPEGTEFDDELIHRANGLSEQLGTRIGTVRAFAKAQLQARTDSLTGLENRRAMEDELNRRLAMGQNFAIAMADLDNFKMLNDAFGHDVGDRALRAFAKSVRSTLREGDLFARWGGEEFVIALPDVSAREATKVLHRAQEALLDLCTRGSVPAFTVSFGVTDNAASPHLEQLLSAADEALMRAKQAGRDAVCVAGVEEPLRRAAPAEDRRAPAEPEADSPPPTALRQVTG